MRCMSEIFDPSRPRQEYVEHSPVITKHLDFVISPVCCLVISYIYHQSTVICCIVILERNNLIHILNQHSQRLAVSFKIQPLLPRPSDRNYIHTPFRRYDVNHGVWTVVDASARS